MGLHPGVTTLIVLSGFSVHLAHTKASETETSISYWARFARRRVLRIAPVYWLAVLLGLLSLAIRVDWGSPGGSLLANLLSTVSGNVLPICLKITFLSGLWPTEEAALGNGILSIVATQMWLYAAYPLVILVLRRAGWLVLLVVAGTMQAGALGLLFVGVKPVQAGSGFLALFLYWAIGVLAAESYGSTVRKGTCSPWHWWVVVASFFAYLLLGYLNFRAAEGIRTAVLAFAVAGLVYSSMLTERKHPTAGSLIARSLAAIGKRSYSLYAVQTPIIFISVGLVAASPLSGILVERCAPLIGVCAVTLLVYQFVEARTQGLSRFLPSSGGSAT